MERQRAQQLRWTVVDEIFEISNRLDESGENLSEEDRIYLDVLAKRVAKTFGVTNHAFL